MLQIRPSKFGGSFNVIIPTVGGGTPEDLAKRILAVQNYGKENNYKVAVVYNNLPFNKSAGRTLSRYLTSGRFTPPGAVYKFRDQPPTNYKAIIERRDKYGVNLSGNAYFESDVTDGESPFARDGSGILQGILARPESQSNKNDGTGSPQYGDGTGFPAVNGQSTNTTLQIWRVVQLKRMNMGGYGMKLTGNLKKTVEKAQTKEEAKEAIRKAGMLLNDDELEMVSGGREADIKIPHPQECQNCGDIINIPGQRFVYCPSCGTKFDE